MFTDHEALLRVSEMKDPFGRRARLLADLAEFDGMTIRPIKGTKNSVADALSRIGFQVGEDLPERRVHKVDLNSGFDMKTAQRSDAEVAQVIAWLENNQKPEKIGKSMSYTVRTLWHKFDSLHLENGILVRTPPHSPLTQQIVPSTLRQSIIKEMHEGKCSGHTGEHKTKESIWKRFYWPGLSRDVKMYCLKCLKCQARRSPVPKLRAPLNPITVNSPGELVTTDITELPVSRKGNRYCLIMADAFTKKIRLFALRKQDAATVSDRIFNGYIPQEGAPHQLHSDQGRLYESELVSQLCQKMSIYKSRTTAYHPEGDGLSERDFRTIKSMLSKRVAKNGLDWDDHLPQIEMAFNSTVHSSTGYTPFLLDRGREINLPIDLIYGGPPSDQTSPREYVQQVIQKYEEAYADARENLGFGQKRQKIHYDKLARHKPYKEGEKVWMNDPKSVRKKLAMKWSGPWKVKKALVNREGQPGLNYKIKEVKGRRSRIVHYNRLKPYVEPNVEETTSSSIEPCTSQAQSTTVDIELDIGMDDPERDVQVQETIQLDIPEGSMDSGPRRSQRTKRQPDRYEPGNN